MVNLAVLLDLTLCDIEGQNQYRMNFSTHPLQNWVEQWQIFTDDFHIWKRTSLGYHTCWG